MKYLEMVARLEACINNPDHDRGHSDADKVLLAAALSTKLKASERQHIAQLWEKVEKWYA